MSERAAANFDEMTPRPNIKQICKDKNIPIENIFDSNLLKTHQINNINQVNSTKPVKFNKLFISTNLIINTLIDKYQKAVFILFYYYSKLISQIKIKKSSNIKHYHFLVHLINLFLLLHILKMLIIEDLPLISNYKKLNWMNSSNKTNIKILNIS